MRVVRKKVGRNLLVVGSLGYSGSIAFACAVRAGQSFDTVTILSLEGGKESRLRASHRTTTSQATRKETSWL